MTREVIENEKNINNQNIEFKQKLCPKYKKKVLEFIKEILKLYLIFTLLYFIQEFLTEDNAIIILGQMGNLIKKYNIKDVFYALYYYLEMADIKYYITIFILISISEIIYSITNRKKLSLIIVTSIIYIYSLINYVVTQIRGSSITIYDIMSINTALGVSNNIEFKLDTNIIIATYLFITIILLITYFYSNYKNNQYKARIISCICSIIILVLIANFSIIKNIRVWDTQISYSNNGIVITLFKLVTNLKYKEPKNYSKKEVEELLGKYNYDIYFNVDYNTDTNVLVIMNESFADFTNNANLEISEDNIPFFHELQKDKNSITGIMHSEGYGSDTANVEYEFLTQNTVAFMPSGAIPYQQYIRTKLPSIVSRMKQLNYTTYGMHLWKKGGYNREYVYKLLEFDHSIFKEDYDDLEYTVNNYTTDECSYSKIKQIFDSKNKDEKLFLFNITMQNHLPYIYTDDEQITYSTQKQLNIYLQMQNYSDTALKELIEYLKEYDEKVILLFFGDHQPNVHIDELKDDQENKYKVPYLIWANYEIEKKEYGEISTNYLQSVLMEAANLPKDSYTNYITELREEIPIITSHYYIGNDGNKYQLQDTSSPYYSKIKEYEKISYYKLKDSFK